MNETLYSDLKDAERRAYIASAIAVCLVCRHGGGPLGDGRDEYDYDRGHLLLRIFGSEEWKPCPAAPIWKMHKSLER
jgi:hypothetical protein